MILLSSESEIVWLTQKQMEGLSGVMHATVSEHTARCLSKKL